MQSPSSSTITHKVLTVNQLQNLIVYYLSHRQLQTKMARKKRDVIYPRLRTQKGNLGADWYVEYSLRNPVSGKMERKRVYEGFKDIPTYEGRIEHGNRLVKEYTAKIDSGEISLTDQIEYTDELLFDTNFNRVRRRVGERSSYRVMASKFLLYKQSEVQKRTMQTYRSKLRLFGEFLHSMNLDTKDIRVIKNKHVVLFLKDCADSGLARLTVEKYQQILYTFFKWAIEIERIDTPNPVMHIARMGRVVDESAPALTESIRAILKKSIEHTDPQLWLACCIQYYTAIRPGTEMRMLQLKNINMELRTITVRNYLAKNLRTEVVDIPDQLYILLLDLNLENYDSDLYLFGRKREPGEHPVGKNTLRVRFNKIRDELGLSKEIKFYSWKHSGALELKESGANMYEIQRHFRHKSVTTTEGYWRKRLGGSGDNIKKNFPTI